ncbi:MAG: cell division protein SepF [Clostridia bacterium]|nr:cell division protein SepF [Clostridia bacterium]
MSDFLEKFKTMMLGEVIEDETMDNEDYSEDIYDDVEDTAADYYEEVEETPFTETVYRPQQAVQPTPAVNNIYHMRPNNIKSAQEVITRVSEGSAVICELYADAAQINQRVVDYISGAVFMAKGSVYALNSKTTFICVPASTQIIPQVSEYDNNSAKVTAL